jgi:hypothetical protein
MIKPYRWEHKTWCSNEFCIVNVLINSVLIKYNYLKDKELFKYEMAFDKIYNELLANFFKI